MFSRGIFGIWMRDLQVSCQLRGRTFHRAAAGLVRAATQCMKARRAHPLFSQTQKTFQMSKFHQNSLHTLSSTWQAVCWHESHKVKESFWLTVRPKAIDKFLSTDELLSWGWASIGQCSVLLGAVGYAFNSSRPVAGSRSTAWDNTFAPCLAADYLGLRNRQLVAGRHNGPISDRLGRHRQIGQPLTGMDACHMGHARQPIENIVDFLRRQFHIGTFWRGNFVSDECWTFLVRE